MSTRRLARVPAGSSAVKIDLHAPGISLQCDRMRKSSRSCPLAYGSASLVETVLMPRKKRHAMTATHTRTKKKQDPSLHGPDDGVVPQVLVARPRRHGLL